MQEMRDRPRESRKEGGKPGKKRRIWRLCAAAAGMAAAMLMIWKLPASQAEKGLKDIDWR